MATRFTSLVAFALGLVGSTARADELVVGDKGFGLESRDGANSFYTHWLIAADFQALLGAAPNVTSRDAFVVRNAGLQLDAIVHRHIHSQLFVDFAQKAALFDAWIQVELHTALAIRVGKFQFPINEERLTSPIALPFVSTSFASLLLPSRDIGVHVLGELGNKAVRYNLALTDGATAGTPIDGDVDSSKDVVGRVFVRPFRHTTWSAVRALGVGVGASAGRHEGTAAAPQLPTLRSYGGQTFFAYRTMPGTPPVANGLVTRIVPHATWAWGPLAVYADFVHVRERVDAATVRTTGWSVIPSLVLTGEDASPLTFVRPARPLDLTNGQLGTIVVIGGLGSIHISDDAFASAADPMIAMQRATVVGGGINWYPFAGIALLANYGYMRFRAFGDAVARPSEHALIVRLQMAL